MNTPGTIDQGLEDENTTQVTTYIPATVVTAKGFDKKAYQREYMAMRRAPA